MQQRENGELSHQAVFTENLVLVFWAKKVLHISYLWNAVEFDTMPCRKLVFQEKNLYKKFGNLYKNKGMKLCL